MRKVFHPKVVSANDLLQGDVVYLTASGAFSRNLADAVVASERETADRLLAKATARPGEVVGPALVDVAVAPGEPPRLLHPREVIRDVGPTHRPDLSRKPETPHVPL